MSLLVRPTKRKLDQVEAPSAQNRLLSPHSSRAQNVVSRVIQLSSHIPGQDGTSPRLEYCSRNEQLDPAGDPHSFPPSLRASPSPQGSPSLSQRVFAPNASIVLIGIRGTGKSSLAVILATTSGRRMIDADQYFQQVTGRSRAAFKKEYDLAEYRQQEARVMESMLAEHKEGCVIACGPGSMERSGQSLLREYAESHPVIHIIRDPESIQSYLKAWDTDKVRRFLELSGPIYRACSNLEFFNVSEKGLADHVGKDGHPHSQLELELDQRSQNFTPFLTLKRLQRDFLKFVAFATGDFKNLSSQQASFPLSMQPVESRMFTYAVTVPLSSLLEHELDIEDLESTADAFELKIDAIGGSPACLGVDSGLADRISQAVATIRRNIIIPLIYHVDSRVISVDAAMQHNGLSRRSEEAYLNFVQHGLRLAPEYLTADLSYSDDTLSQIIGSKGTSKVIGHFAFSRPCPRGWEDTELLAMYERARRLGCDVVRLTQPATTIEDNFAVERFRHHVKSLLWQLPLIAFNTGPLGRLSSCFNPILTSVTPPPLLPEMQAKSLPCITLREAQEALYSSFALDPMRFFVFGANVTYSLSPAMHNAAFKGCGLPHVYTIYQSSSLRGLNDLVENPHFGGTSVSLPYKTEVIPLLHSMSPHARAIGAVNTLIPIRTLPDGADDAFETSLYFEKSRAGPIKALHGDNTDWIGIGNCFRWGLSPANAIRPSSTGLVIGAGGMARAAVYAMIHLGVQNIFVYNRTLANAEKLAHHYNRQNLQAHGRSGPNSQPKVHILRSLHDSWPVNYKQPTVICCCIPAHSIGGVPAPNLQLPSQWLESPTGGVVVELAYKPLVSPLMKQMRALSHRGWVALDGLNVLPEQGFAQFELFTGRRAPRRLMRRVVLQEYKEAEGQEDHHAIRSRLENLDGQAT
ncbi:putative quinate pathway repressor protein QutR [Aspergillus clavatus NRRL 1]|uniref:Quinate pathway repressor protein QutR, putative n=1 Tax=Aspergillus clavatus (strain ATCC 1007 / CBS 513.65 / DSM 816 / NCTC 3887 / NRRL 1 / QM 1276 / 107) TaxID=344612 RepID=A1CPW5_ASPCL|nr:quinate pathway repressor protein QutR, putative [Aspergillus clavatus NRRL 1]EAW07686.1 quinate pathway repressor protein QutR, putative [Aspergillus clavatus NRRL 1]